MRKKITYEKYNKIMDKIIKSGAKRGLQVHETLIEMLEKAGQYDIIGQNDSISLCSKCNCMTKTIKGKCGKCKAKKFGKEEMK